MSRLWKTLSLGLFLSVIAILALTFHHYGPTWDEEAQAQYGDNVLHWYSSFFRDTSALTFRDLYLYGGLFELIAQGIAHHLPADLYDGRHIVNGAFGLLGVLCVWRAGTRIGGPRGGFFASLFLLATPRYYGHLLNNPKDIPFAALSALYLEETLAALETLPEVRPSSILRLGLALGAASAVRVTGLILPLPLLFLRLRRGSLVRLIVLPFLVAWPLMLAFWPWAQLNPLRPLLAPFYLARGGSGWKVLFLGDWISTSSPPWTFVPVWFFVTLPEFYFVALLVGVWPRLSTIAGRFLALSVVLPPLIAILVRSRQYDAARHFLFLLPPLAILAGTAASDLLSGARAARAAAGVALASLALTLLAMVRLHPYEYVYFNSLAGGLRGASGRFQLDYWGMSYKEAATWLLEYYPKRERVRPILVANCSLDFLTEHVIRRDARFQEVRKKDDPHVFLALENEECDVPLRGLLLYTVAREGVPLLEVREFRHPSG